MKVVETIKEQQKIMTTFKTKFENSTSELENRIDRYVLLKCAKSGTQVEEFMRSVQESEERRRLVNETQGPEYDEVYDEDYLAASKELQRPPIRIGNLGDSSSSDSLTSEASSFETERDQVKQLLDLHKKDTLNLGRSKML